MESKLQCIIARNIRRLRKSEKLSQANLSIKLDKSQNYVDLIENRKIWPTLDDVEKIAKFFDIKPYQLLIEEEQHLLR